MPRARTLTNASEHPRNSIAFALGAIVIVAFLAGALHRFYPFVDDVDPVHSAGEDWLEYKKHAIDILDHGLSMPSIRRAYYQPGGFLYNYFIAAVFGLFGRNTAPVYVIQSALLGVAAVLFYVAFRRSFTQTASLLYLTATAFFLYIDVALQWGGLLLSESLTTFLLAVALALLVGARRSDRVVAYALSGLAFGLVVLTRQNLGIAPLAVAAIIGATTQRGGRIRRTAAFLAPAFATVLILPIRNAVAVGTFAFSDRYGSHFPNRFDLDYLDLVFWKSLFTFGIVQTDTNLGFAGLIVIKHWLVLNVAALAYLAILVRKRSATFEEIVAIALILCAYVPFILMPLLAAYGLRFQMPYGALVLFLVFRLFITTRTPVATSGVTDQKRRRK